jgi:Amt family ammonium transporter
MKYLISTFIGLALSTTSVFAQEVASIDTGDTAWMLIATALVMLMTPAGLALFYGGLTQNKHVLNTIGMSYMAFCTGTIVWVIAGYSLAFGAGNAWIGDFSHFLLADIGVNDVSGSIPTLLFVVFQGTFRRNCCCYC